MDRCSLDRRLRAASGIAVAALVTLLVASPAADAGGNGVLRHTYRIYGVDYKAVGELEALGRGTCAGSAAWGGNVTTTENIGLSALRTDVNLVSLKVHAGGTTGGGTQTIDVTSTLSGGHYEDTANCDGSDNPFKQELCSIGPDDSKMVVSLKIRGGVGDRLTLTWDFRQGTTKLAGALVPDVYRCGPQSLLFPDGKCTTRSTIKAFNRKAVALPFRCVANTSKPPPMVSATLYTGTVTATGKLQLSRKS